MPVLKRSVYRGVSPYLPMERLACTVPRIEKNSPCLLSCNRAGPLALDLGSPRVARESSEGRRFSCFQAKSHRRRILVYNVLTRAHVSSQRVHPRDPRISMRNSRLNKSLCTRGSHLFTVLSCLPFAYEQIAMVNVHVSLFARLARNVRVHL